MAPSDSDKLHDGSGATRGQVCTYLGRCDDAANYYAFPTVGNCCHTEKRPFAVDYSYQANTCLGKDWQGCPRYQAATSQAEGPTAAAAPALQQGVKARWLIVPVVAGLAILTIALFFLFKPPVPDSPPAAVPTSVPPATTSNELALAQPSPSSTAGLMASVSPTPTVIPSQAPVATAAVSTPTFTPSPTATASRTATSTATPSATPSRTPAPLVTETQAASTTPTRTTTHTVTATRTPTRTATPTRTVRPTPAPTTSRPAPTRRPTATATPFPAPVLLAPGDGAEFPSDAEIVLSWQPVGQLPDDGYYVITVAFSHLGETWHDETPWIKDTSWVLSDHRYLLDRNLCDDGQFHWSVQVVRQPAGTAISPPSAVRTLKWQLEAGGGGEPPAQPQPPANTPAPPPPSQSTPVPPSPL